MVGKGVDRVLEELELGLDDDDRDASRLALFGVVPEEVRLQL